MWTLPQAIEFINEITPQIKEVGYGIALAGGVLLRGESNTDLDLILYPMSTANQNLGLLHTKLQHLGLELKKDKSQVRKIWKSKGSLDLKHVEVWAYNDKRIDLFFLS